MSISEALRYGATELKGVYNRNLGLALGISVGIHLALIGLYIFSLNIGKADSDGKAAPVAKIKLTTLAPPPVEDATPPPPPPMVPPQLQTGGGGGGGVASRAGTPVAVPDALIAPDVKEFAATTEIAVATPEGGDGTGFGPKTDGEGLGGPIAINEPVQVKNVEKLPEMDEFIAVEEEPKWDPSELQRRIKYPEIARRNNIEGTVVVRALVDKNGRVVKTAVDRSDNKVLENAAIDAVTATPFTPAIQNKVPVAIWIAIPVTFRLS
jgi:protein TonB